MVHHLKNLSGIPTDIATLNGPAILPAYGEITVELSAFEAEVMHHSPDIEIIDALDHYGDGKRGGAAPNDPPSERDDLKAQAAELGIDHARNIGTDKLRALIDAKLGE